MTLSRGTLRPGMSGAFRGGLAKLGEAAGTLLVLIPLTFAGPAGAAIVFQDVTAQSGIDFVGRSFGLSWGDYNGDGWPDIFTGNHRTLASLWSNNHNGTFTNVIPSHWTNPTEPDAHGAAWGDFDNDGDQDLMQLAGAGSGVGSSPNLFLVSHDGLVTDEAAERGVTYPLGRGRTPLWLDWNNDGMLDLFFSNLTRPDGQAPSVYFQQNDGVFTIPNIDGLTSNVANLFSQASDLLGDGTQMLVIHNQFSYPARILAFGSDPAVDLRSQINLPTTAQVRDVAIEDFNGDLLPDFYLARMDPSASDSVLTDPRTLKTYFNVSGNERGVSFRCACTLNFVLGPAWEITTSNVFIGSAGAHPSATTFTVSSTDASVQGIAPHTPGVSFGLYVGYAPATQTWTVLASKSTIMTLNVLITSSANITNLQLINMNPSALPLVDRLLLQTATGWVAATNSPGISTPTACESVAAGDYDNDMDVDLYLVCRGQVTNLPNILLENNGSGVFTVVPAAGGAEGSMDGRGDSVGTGDYNNDGFLDLFVTNGNGEVPFTDGPYQLFRNAGNGNHWIELHLRGVQSNRDGVGAKVILTAGGKSQMREQNGRMHRIAQDHDRLHFGLAGNTVVDTITIHWPSGIVQTLNDVAADQILQVTESGGGPVNCGAPVYNPAVDTGIFLWQDCSGGQWHARMTAAAGYRVYEGEVESSLGFSSVSGFSLESGDIVDATTNPGSLNYRLAVGSSFQDGFDFSVPSGSTLCFESPSPTGTQIFVGPTRTPATAPFNPETLGTCNTGVQPSLSVNNISVAENGGQANFTLTLSNSSTDSISVDYATGSGTATPGSDYISATGGVTFTPGQTSRIVSVQILDDALVEGNETFTLNLSNVINAVLANATGVATIIDDDVANCGAPSYNPAVDTAVFVWRDCTTGQWHARMTNASTFRVFEGDVTSSLPYTAVTGFSLESGDVVDATSNPTVIDYRLAVGTGFQDGFDFFTPVGATLCFDLSSPTGTPVLVGPTRTPASVPFNPETLGACTGGGTQPSLTIDDVTVSEGAGTASFGLHLSQSSPDTVTVHYATADGTATAGSDYVATSGNASFAPGATSLNVNVPILDDNLAEGSEFFRLDLSSAVNATLVDASAIGTIVDNEGGACGEPSYNPAVDTAVFVWKDCTVGDWHVRVTAGAGFRIYEGEVEANQPFSSVTGFSLESADTLDNANPLIIDYRLRLSPPNVDGFDFSYPAGAHACFELYSPVGAQVLLGESRVPVNLPFDLDTLAACQ